MNSLLKKSGLSLLQYGGLFQLGRWIHRNEITVITYHRVLPDRLRRLKHQPKDSIFKTVFENQIRFIANHYHVLTGDDLREFLGRRSNVPKRSVFITFDDGFENNYTEAFPILKKYGITATFFLTTGHINSNNDLLWFDRLDHVLDTVSWPKVAKWLSPRRFADNTFENGRIFREWLKKQGKGTRENIISALEKKFGYTVQPYRFNDPVAWRMMNWDQVREMSRQGMTIGSHTESHQILSSSIKEEVLNELENSKAHSENQIKKPCWCFSYPNGTEADFRFSDKIALKGAGYECAFTQLPGFICSKSDSYALPRISLSESSNPNIFQSKLSGVKNILQGVLK